MCVTHSTLRLIIAACMKYNMCLVDWPHTCRWPMQRLRQQLPRQVADRRPVHQRSNHSQAMNAWLSFNSKMRSCMKTCRRCASCKQVGPQLHQQVPTTGLSPSLSFANNWAPTSTFTFFCISRCQQLDSHSRRGLSAKASQDANVVCASMGVRKLDAAWLALVGRQAEQLMGSQSVPEWNALSLCITSASAEYCAMHCASM